MKKLLLLSVTLVFSFMYFSCKKDKTDPVKKTFDLSSDIKNIVPDSTIQSLIDLGMIINDGTTPPNLENIYKVSPYVLKSSNIPSDYEGQTFTDYKFKLYDQDDVNQTIKLDYVNNPETGTGLGGFISGSGNNFSVFVKVHTLVFDSPADILFVLSGTITDGGIDNFIMSNYMLDNYGNLSGYYIENGQGRIIYDSDLFSPTVDDLLAKTMNNTLNNFGNSGVLKMK
jgi:hypothetical protein